MNTDNILVPIETADVDDGKVYCKGCGSCLGERGYGYDPSHTLTDCLRTISLNLDELAARKESP